VKSHHIYNKEVEIFNKYKAFCKKIENDHVTKEEVQFKYLNICDHYEELLNHVEIIAKVSDRLENKLIKTTEQLTEAVAAKDKFFSIIAHDLKNPMQGLIYYSYLLTTNFKNNNTKEVEKQIKNIDKAIQQTVDLVENLLQWSRAQIKRLECKPEKIEVYPIVINNIELLSKNADIKKIKLINDVDKNARAFADGNMVTTVIRNLMSNAIKFTPIDGKVEVSARPVRKYIEISITDSGVGMSEEVKSKLFRIDVSSTTPGTSGEKGSGLGLILCKEFIEKNGGTIWVDSEEGSGSSFRFTLIKNSPRKKANN